MTLRLAFGWKALHRWVGLLAGAVALVLAVTGVLLAADPVQRAWQSPPMPLATSVAALAGRVAQTVPGAQEIRRLPSGMLVVHAFDGDQARAVRVDPADGRVLGGYEASLMPRWVKNLHRSLLLGDAGRWGTALTALAMLALSVSGLVLLLRRMGGWRRLTGAVRGTLAQRVHVLIGRVALVALLVSSISALYLSAATLGLIGRDATGDAEMISRVAPGAAAVDRAPERLPALQGIALTDLRKLSFPDASDPEDVWQVVTVDGSGGIDRYSGQWLGWQRASLGQRLDEWALLLHSGDGAWPWALALAVLAASIPLFWISGVFIWWQARRDRPRFEHNAAVADADVLIFVASEGGSSWGFAEALHGAFVAAGHRVHADALERFHVGPRARQVLVLAATYGEGQAPAHARDALAVIARQPVRPIPVTVLGFGDRQFPAFCAFAEDVERVLRERGWPSLLPLERVHQQSAQQFARWCEALAAALGEPLQPRYRPRLPATTSLTLVARQEFAAREGSRSAILRFAWPAQSRWQRWLGRGLGRFEAGDLIAIVPPGSTVPRYYSLASGSADGFVEICVRHLPGGLCSTHLLGLAPGDGVDAFIRANPGFALPRRRRPVLLIGAGTGVAPLAGFIRRNERRAPMHLFFGSRDPAKDFYFQPELARWRDDGRVATVRTAFSRVPGGGGYVQDALRHDADRVRQLLADGAVVRVCGSRPMAQGVADALDAILAGLRSSVHQLKLQGRYAEDVF